MTSSRRGVGFVVAGAALALLLPACAAPRIERPYPAWSYAETKLPEHWWYEHVGVRAAQAKGVTGANVTIAFVDTGVLPNHEDLPVPTGMAATCGKPDDITDRSGHGTQLAGITLGKAAGHSTLGVAPGASLLAIKVDCGLVTAPALAQGIDQAIQRQPAVIVLAIGGYPSGSPNVDTFPDIATFLKDRVGANRDILFVVASVWDGTVYPFPEWTRSTNVVVVAAMTLAGDRGSPYLEIPYDGRRGDISAPGRDIDTADILPDPRNPERHARFYMQGTSAAAAIVAGCAALVKEKSGDAGVSIKDALVRRAESKPHLESKRLNCAAAVP